MSILAWREVQYAFVDWDSVATKVNRELVFLALDVDVQEALSSHLRSLFDDQRCLIPAGNQAVGDEVGPERPGRAPGRGIFDNAVLIGLEHTCEGVKISLLVGLWLKGEDI